MFREYDSPHFRVRDDSRSKRINSHGLSRRRLFYFGGERWHMPNHVAAHWRAKFCPFGMGFFRRGIFGKLNDSLAGKKVKRARAPTVFTGESFAAKDADALSKR